MRAARLAVVMLAGSLALAETATAALQFQVSTPLNVPRRIYSMAVGDLNNDGIDDIALVSRGTNKVSIVLIEADGGFRQGASVIVGSRLKGIGIGDFNGDGNGDLVVTTGSRNTFVIPGNGDGTFGNSSRLVRCCSGEGVAVGDFDNSRPGSKFGDDIAITNPAKDNVSLYINENRPNAISFSQERRLTAGNKPFNILVHDFDGSGFQDLAALNIFGSGNDVSILMNNSQPGVASFRNVANFFAGLRARSLGVGDLNGDGLPDLVAGDIRNKRVSILTNLGGGFFGAASPFPIACISEDGTQTSLCRVRSVLVADYDGDGNNDLAVLLSGINLVRFFPGDGTGNLLDPATVGGLGRESQLMLPGNFNSDDKPDIVVGSRSDSALRILINLSQPGTGVTVTPTTGVPLGTPTPSVTGGVGVNTPTPTPPDCRGQGCPCNPSNGDDDCNAPFFCAVDDAVCCDTPCDIEGVSCSLPGFVGTCMPTDLTNGDECMTGEQCVSGICIDGVCCNSQCDGPFDRCDVQPGMCIQSTPRSTTPTVVATATPTVRLRDLGESCTAPSQCLSNFCPAEDLVCCNQACNGPNEACALPGVAGQCLPINLPDNELCQVDQQCISNVCDGGLCRSLPTRTQTPLGPTPTPTSARGPGGTSCTSGDDCESGFCPAEDGVCCNEPCDGPNERCDLPEAMGVCLDDDLPDGATCSFPSQCLSRICDGNICRSSQTRTPTSTRTPTPNTQPTLILARGSGCSVGDESGGMGSLALLLLAPAGWWFATRRVPVPVRRRRRR